MHSVLVALSRSPRAAWWRSLGARLGGASIAAELTESADLAGSSALRLYSSFVNPKSAGALANAQKPQRAAAIARAIDFELRERRAFRDEWLRNHDRALAELPEDATRYPLLLVLDNVRSAANVGNMLRAAGCG